MKTKIKIHDGIVGMIILLSILLAYAVDARWAMVAAVTGGLMVASAFTGFCPVYSILDKFMPSDDKDKGC